MAVSLSATSALVADGQVTDLAGQPVAGLTVRATSSWSVIYTAQTGADGRYAIVGSAPNACQPTDTYEVAFLPVASGLSFANSSYYDAREPQFGGAVLVPAGQTTSGIDVQLEPPRQITGTVTDRQGRPLSTALSARESGPNLHPADNASSIVRVVRTSR